MILVRGASGVDKRNAVKYVKEGVVRLSKNNAVYMFTEQVLRFLGMSRELAHRPNIVRDSNFVAIQIFDPQVRQGSQIPLEVIASHGENRALVPSQRF